MQTVNEASRNAKTLKLHSEVGFEHEGARRSEPPLAIRHHSVAEVASTSELNSPAQLAEVFFTSRTKRSSPSAPETAVCVDLRAETGTAEAVTPGFSLGARFRFLNVVRTRLIRGQLHRERRDTTVPCCVISLGNGPGLACKQNHGPLFGGRGED